MYWKWLKYLVGPSKFALATIFVELTKEFFFIEQTLIQMCVVQ